MEVEPSIKERRKLLFQKLLVTACALIVEFFYLFSPAPLWAETIEELKAGVVKIAAEVDGKRRVGTGFIVNLEENAAYIVTVAHVIEGDQRPQVAFFPQANQFMSARVLGLDGGDPNGLAALIVEGQLPEGLRPLIADTELQVRGGEESTIIGFPGEAGTPWLVTAGNIGGRKGSRLTFTGVISEGSSGSPLLVNDKVVGVVTEMGNRLGYAVPMVTARFSLEGWGVELAEKKLDEITGKDGAPMVFIPAGEFTMGSDEGEADERPAHRVFVDAFYIDKYEVTTDLFFKFLRATNSATPPDWTQVRLTQHADLPVVGINWYIADAYCQWAGKRLPTSAEWEKAARGTGGLKYPWGYEDPTTELANYGQSVSDAVYDDRLATVDSYKSGTSPYGIYNMAGNVGEWVSNKSVVFSGYRLVRGGSWRLAARSLRSSYKGSRHSGDAYNDIGFRCAQDAP